MRDFHLDCGLHEHDVCHRSKCIRHREQLRKFTRAAYGSRFSLACQKFTVHFPLLCLLFIGIINTTSRNLPLLSVSLTYSAARGVVSSGSAGQSDRRLSCKSPVDHTIAYLYLFKFHCNKRSGVNQSTWHCHYIYCILW